MVNLDQRDVVMVDFAVFKQAPELQAGQQKGAMRRVGTAKPAVELIHRPQLCAVYQHLELHLSQMRRGIRPRRGLQCEQLEPAADLVALRFPLFLWDQIQQPVDVQGHVCVREAGEK